MMPLESNCTRCDGTGFLNIHQLPESIEQDNPEEVQEWIDEQEVLFKDPQHDVMVCDCCGNGETWSHRPGYHNIDEEPIYDCM